MKPLSFAALWRDTLTDTRVLLPLVWPVAAAFVLLPSVATDRFGPPVAAPQVIAAPPESRHLPGMGTATATASPATARPAALRLSLPPARTVVIDGLIPMLIGLIAQAAIVRLALDRRRGISRSVGEALAAGARAWPLLVVALALGAVPIGCGLLALVVPGFYVAGQLGIAVPLVLDGTAPLAALEASWALTAGNGWRVIGFTAVIFGWFVLASAVTGLVGAGVATVLAAAGAGGAGAVVAATLDGALAALAAVVNSVALATIYRQLK